MTEWTHSENQSLRKLNKIHLLFSALFSVTVDRIQQESHSQALEKKATLEVFFLSSFDSVLSSFTFGISWFTPLALSTLCLLCNAKNSKQFHNLAVDFVSFVPFHILRNISFFARPHEIYWRGRLLSHPLFLQNALISILSF